MKFYPVIELFNIVNVLESRATVEMHSAVVLLTESSHFKLCSNVLISPLAGEWCLFKCAILIDHM